MSEAHDILADVVADRAPGTTDQVLNLRTNIPFTAELDGTPDALVVMTELGEDVREVVLIYVTDRNQAAAQNLNDQVQFKLFGALETYQIIKRRDSATPQVQFWARKVINGKDA